MDHSAKWKVLCVRGVSYNLLKLAADFCLSKEGGAKHLKHVAKLSTLMFVLQVLRSGTPWSKQ